MLWCLMTDKPRDSMRGNPRFTLSAQRYILCRSAWSFGRTSPQCSPSSTQEPQRDSHHHRHGSSPTHNHRPHTAIVIAHRRRCRLTPTPVTSATLRIHQQQDEQRCSTAAAWVTGLRCVCVFVCMCMCVCLYVLMSAFRCANAFPIPHIRKHSELLPAHAIA